jgi:two-component system, NarL family, nitrate/nitrite response regulator NarL
MPTLRLEIAPVRTLLADDSAFVRLAVRTRLEDAGFEICAEADDAESAVAAAMLEQPDLCLLDVTLSGGGLAAIRALCAAAPKSAIVVLTDAAQEDMFLEAVRAGASGFLLKTMNPARIPHAVRDVVDGKTALPRSLVGLLLDELAA